MEASLLKHTPVSGLVSFLIIFTFALAAVPCPADTQRGIAAMNRKDYKTAWFEFMESAKQGDPEAEAAVGGMLLNHLNPPVTGFYYEAEQWLKASADQGNPKGMSFLGKFYYNDAMRLQEYQPREANARLAQARALFEKAASLGDGYAMGNLAIFLDSGFGGPVDHARAEQLRQQMNHKTDPAFAQKVTADPAGQAMTAQWQQGHYAEALQSAQQRAAKGEAASQALLGRAYYQGTGVPRNYRTALYWLNLAVAQKNPDAMFFLGLMYEHARGVPQDLDRAIRLFDQAAALGQSYARMEAKGMRLQAESNRVAAKIHANSCIEQNACFTAGGVYGGGMCLRNGELIDPYAIPH